jgi:hypothetical protein
LAQLAHAYPFLRGTLSVRSRQCGKPNCRCARGQLHVSLYVVQSHEGRPRQVYVPKEWQERIRRAVQNHQEMQTLIEELSELQWKRLRERKE